VAYKDNASLQMKELNVF